jgi:uncharacterized membrane protein
MLNRISAIVALISFVSIAALPWWILANPTADWKLPAGAFLVWLLLGTMSVAVRDGRGNRGEGRP